MKQNFIDLIVHCNYCSAELWFFQRKSENSGIKDRRWGRLSDEGLCMLLGSKQLGIPYCVFRLAASIDQSQVSLPAAKCMVQVLHYMRDHVDNVLYDKEPWQLWETFSACFFALRVNSMILLGATECSFSELCRGAVVKGCSLEVILCPIEVLS
jgi:hypothetical protein